MGLVNEQCAGGQGLGLSILRAGTRAGGMLLVRKNYREEGDLMWAVLEKGLQTEGAL